VKDTSVSKENHLLSPENIVTQISSSDLQEKITMLKNLIEEFLEKNSKDKLFIQCDETLPIHSCVRKLTSLISSENSETALHFAAANGNTDIVKLLIAHGANPMTKEICLGETPLHSASAKGHLDVVASLLDNGADVNSKTYYGITPLFMALQAEDPRMVALLLKYNADITVKVFDINGLNIPYRMDVWNLAKRTKNPEIFIEILSKAKNPGQHNILSSTNDMPRSSDLSFYTTQDSKGSYR
jgi:ankyrin repeat protein